MQTSGGFQEPPLSSEDGWLIYSSWANWAQFRFNKLACLNLIYLLQYGSLVFLSDFLLLLRKNNSLVFYKRLGGQHAEIILKKNVKRVIKLQYAMNI